MEVAIKSAGLTLRGLLEGSDQVPNDRIAILMHGFKGDLGYTEENLLNQLAHRLNDQGLATLRFDFAGCGKSDGQFSDMTVLSELQDGMKIIPPGGSGKGNHPGWPLTRRGGGFDARRLLPRRD